MTKLLSSGFILSSVLLSCTVFAAGSDAPTGPHISVPVNRDARLEDNSTLKGTARSGGQYIMKCETPMSSEYGGYTHVLAPVMRFYLSREYQTVMPATPESCQRALQTALRKINSGKSPSIEYSDSFFAIKSQ